MQTAVFAAVLTIVQGHAAEKGAHAHGHGGNTRERFARQAVNEEGDLSENVVEQLISKYGFMVRYLGATTWTSTPVLWPECPQSMCTAGAAADDTLKC